MKISDHYDTNYLCPTICRKILLVRLTVNRNASLFQIRVTCFARYTGWLWLYTMHCTLYTSELYTMHCLTRIRFVLVLRKIHFLLDDKLHFCGICIVMKIEPEAKAITLNVLDRKFFWFILFKRFRCLYVNFHVLEIISELLRCGGTFQLTNSGSFNSLLCCVLRPSENGESRRGKCSTDRKRVATGHLCFLLRLVHCNGFFPNDSYGLLALSP